MKTIESFFSSIEWLISRTISILLAAMSVVIFYQVVLRYLFHGANIWAEEFARFSFVWIVMLGSAIGIRKYKHIRIDFFINLFSPKLRKVTDFLTYILMIVFIIVLLKYGITLTVSAGSKVSSGLHISMAFMYSSIPVSCGLMLALISENIIKEFILPLVNKGEIETKQL